MLEGGVEAGGRWGAEGGLTQPFRLKQHCFTFSMRHELTEFTRRAKTAARNSLVPHAVLLLPLIAENLSSQFSRIGKTCL